MKHSFIKILFIATSILILSMTLYYNNVDKSELMLSSNTNGLVLIHELEQEIQKNDYTLKIQEKIEELKQHYQNNELDQLDSIGNRLLPYLIMLIIYILFLFCYVYNVIWKPFLALGNYADEIAKGNVNVSISYHRSNYFGAFTWAFDHMREELIQAKQNEEKALQNHKTIIASLSHDIKTPIASIRAYAEGLEANMDTTYEQRQRYLAVIIKKCDEVVCLSNDLLLHSISELKDLNFHCTLCNVPYLLQKILQDFNFSNITINYDVATYEQMLDEKRFAQVIENILNNAMKYAKDCTMELWTKTTVQCYQIHIRDYGEGIPDEDFPYIFQKLYRGHNVNRQAGSGLGLYIAKYIMQRMDGDIKLCNHPDGLEVILYFSH